MIRKADPRRGPNVRFPPIPVIRETSFGSKLSACRHIDLEAVKRASDMRAFAVPDASQINLGDQEAPASHLKLFEDVVTAVALATQGLLVRGQAQPMPPRLARARVRSREKL